MSCLFAEQLAGSHCYDLHLECDGLWNANNGLGSTRDFRRGEWQSSHTKGVIDECSVHICCHAYNLFDEEANNEFKVNHLVFLKVVIQGKTLEKYFTEHDLKNEADLEQSVITILT